MKIDFKTVEHIVFVFVAAVVSQVAIGGQPLDITTNVGRSAAATAVLVTIWRAIRETEKSASGA